MSARRTLLLSILVIAGCAHPGAGSDAHATARVVRRSRSDYHGTAAQQRAYSVAEAERRDEEAHARTPIDAGATPGARGVTGPLTVDP